MQTCIRDLFYFGYFSMRGGGIAFQISFNTSNLLQLKSNSPSSKQSSGLIGIMTRPIKISIPPSDTSKIRTDAEKGERTLVSKIIIMIAMVSHDHCVKPMQKGGIWVGLGGWPAKIPPNQSAKAASW